MSDALTAFIEAIPLDPDRFVPLRRCLRSSRQRVEMGEVWEDGAYAVRKAILARYAAKWKRRRIRRGVWSRPAARKP